MAEIVDSFISPYRDAIISWYSQNQRDLPWRRTRDPYKIWLSEVILQQTRVNQGLPYYLEFMNRFPTVYDLAHAKEAEILRVWQGLGYYSRAKNLHKCAKIIVANFEGKFPNSYKSLIQLPGIGAYTGAAIASICFNEPVAVVDGNVYRVLSRVLGIDTPTTSTLGVKEFSSAANMLLEPLRPDVYNQAIMEFGACHCTPKNPLCDECPLSNMCYAFANNSQGQLPVKGKKTKVRDRYFYYMVLNYENKLALKQRVEKDIWSGLFDFPLIEKDNRLADDEEIAKTCADLFPKSAILDISEEYKHILSHQRIHARFIKINTSEDVKQTFYSLADIHDLPKPILINNYLNQHVF